MKKRQAKFASSDAEIARLSATATDDKATPLRKLDRDLISAGRSQKKQKRPHVPTLAETRKANKAFRELLNKNPDIDVLMRVVKRSFAARARSRSHPAKEREFASKVSQVLTSAGEVIGSEDAGNLWILTPQPALGDRKPLSLLRTERGRKEVVALLTGIAAGNFQ